MNRPATNLGLTVANLSLMERFCVCADPFTSRGRGRVEWISAGDLVDQLPGKDLHDLVAVFVDIEDELGGVHKRRQPAVTDNLATCTLANATGARLEQG